MDTRLKLNKKLTFGDQNLGIVCLWYLNSDSFFNGFNTVGEFILETFPFNIRNDTEMRVSDPGFQGFLVKNPSKLDSFRSGNIVFQSIELFSTVGC